MKTKKEIAENQIRIHQEIKGYQVTEQGIILILE